MARRIEPTKKSIPEILGDLRDGYREADIVGPAAALKFLERTQESQHSLPNAVKCFLFDLLAETRAQLGDWEGCDAAVKGAEQTIAGTGWLPSTLQTRMPVEIVRNEAVVGGEEQQRASTSAV